MGYMRSYDVVGLVFIEIWKNFKIFEKIWKITKKNYKILYQTKIPFQNQMKNIKSNPKKQFLVSY